MKRRLLLCVALALAGCGSQTVMVRTRTLTAPVPTIPSTTRSIAAPATSTPPSITSPFARATATTRASGEVALPAGGPVPTGFRAASVSFVSASVAYVLGTAPCHHPVCTSLLRTEDRGGDWVGLPAPVAPIGGRGDPGVASLRFADRMHGLATGAQLWETDDGAAHWHRGALPPGRLVDLEPVADREWVALMADGHDLVLDRCPVSGGGWTEVTRRTTTGSPAGRTGTLSVHGDTVWAVEGDRILVSVDDAASFVSAPEPTAKVPASFIADDGPSTFALVGDQPGADSERKQAYRWRGGGWGPLGAVPRGGLATGVAAGGDGALVVAASSGAAVLYRSADAGGSWSTAKVFSDGGEELGDLGFITARDGVVIEGPATSSGYGSGRLWLTEDGGASWHRVTFSVPARETAQPPEEPNDEVEAP